MRISSPQSPLRRIILGLLLLVVFIGLAFNRYEGFAAGGPALAVVDLLVGVGVVALLIVALARHR
jgi:hypothetical protein